MWCFPTFAETFTGESGCPYWGGLKTVFVSSPLWHCKAASIQRRIINRCERGLFHFTSCCDLLHTAWQPAVNKDFHNLLWPFPISSTTGLWRKLAGAQEEQHRKLLRYHQHTGSEAASVVVERIQLASMLIWPRLRKQSWNKGSLPHISVGRKQCNKLSSWRDIFIMDSTSGPKLCYKKQNSKKFLQPSF